MQHYSSQAFTDIGKPAAGATITVKLAGSNTNATIYSDDGITVKSNPFVSNNLGQFDFYTASGKYDITVTGTQITTYTLPNQVVFDPFEVSSADSIVVNGGGPPLNGVNSGGFFGMTIWPPTSTGGFTGIAGAINQVVVWQFVLPFAAVVNKVTVSVFNSAVGQGDVGIYSLTGQRLIYTNGGINMNVAGGQTVSIVGGPITMPAGIYYLAQVASVITGTIQMVCLNAPWLIVMTNNVGTTHSATAANAASAGILPATLGGLTLQQLVPPVLAFFER